MPIITDRFSFDGLKEPSEQFEAVKELNSALTFRGCLVTRFVKNDVNTQGEIHLSSQKLYPMFKIHIRRTAKVDEGTFSSPPINEYSQRCGAAKDYLSFVKEYLGQ